MDELTKLFGDTEKVWMYIQQYAGTAGREATRMVLELYYVVKSPDTSRIDKTIIVAALGHQLLPEDLMPKDKYGLLGLLDNGAALGIAYNKVQRLVTPEIRSQVNAILEQWFGEEQKVINDNTYQQPNEFFNPQPKPVQANSDIRHSHPMQPAQPYDDDEDVIID